MRAVMAVALVAACAGSAPRPAAAPRRRLGDAMGEAGQRFNRVGRAVLAGRWELATYDLKELDEIFGEDLAASSWLGKPKLSELAHQFQSRELAAIRTAVHAKDRDASQQAVAQAARACNECHKAADMGYIEISEALGAEVPVVGAK